ncbi:hypothetical protein D9758_012739 [Tetrapyrgos nigripes]|uniref:Uncharacterized protein n=1 Tax=Tetrapyrgos nigripes TaxID=182062 RepID=A0A8H5FQZ9_9AGAR|nr:hypothetical protein D9758_012739 [Tetrapyrgos nigripes]
MQTVTEDEGSDQSVFRPHSMAPTPLADPVLTSDGHMGLEHGWPRKPGRRIWIYRQRLAGEGDAERFFQHIQNRIQDEVQRATEVFSPTSWSIIRETTEQALLDGRLERLANSNLGPYMTAKDFVKLSEMKKSNPSSKTDLKTTIWFNFSSISELSPKTPSTPVLLTPPLLLTRPPLQVFPTVHPVPPLPELVINQPWSLHLLLQPAQPPLPVTKPPTQTPNKDFFYAHTDAFTQGFKARRSKPAEMIARYLDKAMRKEQGAQSTKEYEGMLDKAVGEEVVDWEECELGCGAENGYNPEFDLGESMFNDLKLSEDLMREYSVEDNTKKDELKAKYKKPEQDKQKKNKDIDVDKIEDALAYDGGSIPTQCLAFQRPEEENHSIFGVRFWVGMGLDEGRGVVELKETRLRQRDATTNTDVTSHLLLTLAPTISTNQWIKVTPMLNL